MDFFSAFGIVQVLAAMSCSIRGLVQASIMRYGVPLSPRAWMTLRARWCAGLLHVQ